MMSIIVRSIKATVLLAIILCGFYPAAVWVMGSTLFHDKAAGQVIYKDDQLIGSKIIGQYFSRPDYFRGRPSAAGEKGYDGTSSGGSNLGPLNEKLSSRIKNDIETVLKDNPTLSKGNIPVDLVTTSGSGLDPHISPEAAQAQIERIARIRHLPVEQVKALIEKNTLGPQLGLFGDSTVNVLQLNLALDELREPDHAELSSK